MPPENEAPLPQLSGREFSEYIVHHAAQLTVGDVDDLAQRLPALRKRFIKVQAPGFPNVAAQLGLLADVVQTFSDGEARQLPYKAAVEAAIALLYLDRGADLIPVVLPEIGYLDDAAIANTVVERNADALREFASVRGADWEKAAPATAGA
jgi:uncharacterized membrane protein YkvA (DUF1232 family)